MSVLTDSVRFIACLRVECRAIPSLSGLMAERVSSTPGGPSSTSGFCVDGKTQSTACAVTRPTSCWVVLRMSGTLTCSGASALFCCIGEKCVSVYSIVQSFHKKPSTPAGSTVPSTSHMCLFCDATLSILDRRSRKSLQRDQSTIPGDAQRSRGTLS